MTITSQHVDLSHKFMAAVAQTCEARGLKMPDIRRVQIAERNARLYSIAIFPDTLTGKLEAYESAGFLHQISTALKGLPVTYSNHTGFRLIAGIDGYQVERPARLNYPGHLVGQVRLGIDQAGREVSKSWAQLGHALIVGMTGFGKTSTMRVIIADALADDCRLVLGDLHESTFPMLRGHSSLLAPIGHSILDYIDLMKLLQQVQAQRKARYAALHVRDIYPDDLDEYNAAVEPAQRLPRIVAIFDEFSTACDQDNGAKGELAHLAFQLATEVRKFGINLIFAGQAINADLVGPMRDQLVTRICFRVARRDVSRIAVRPGAEALKEPGHALMQDGRMQAYYLDKTEMTALAKGGRQAVAAVSAETGAVSFAASSANLVDEGHRATSPVGVSPLRLTVDEQRMVKAARAAGGWFKIDEVAAATGLGRNNVNEVARRWANDGLLTGVLTDDQGRRLGRKITARLAS